MRKRKCRRVRCSPGIRIFKPAGVPAHGTPIFLATDELEAMRLVDLEGLKQEKAAEKMEISQPTLHRILKQAREKLADAIINGKPIAIKEVEWAKTERGCRRGRSMHDME